MKLRTLTGLAAVPALADGGATVSVTSDGTNFFCGESMDVVYGFTPDLVDTPVMRGYSVRIIAPPGLTFDQGDILVNSPLIGVNDTHMIIRNGDGDYNIDFTFLDTGTRSLSKSSGMWMPSGMCIGRCRGC